MNIYIYISYIYIHIFFYRIVFTLHIIAYLHSEQETWLVDITWHPTAVFHDPPGGNFTSSSFNGPISTNVFLTLPWQQDGAAFLARNQQLLGDYITGRLRDVRGRVSMVTVKFHVAIGLQSGVPGQVTYTDTHQCTWSQYMLMIFHLGPKEFESSWTYSEVVKWLYFAEPTIVHLPM